MKASRKMPFRNGLTRRIQNKVEMKKNLLSLYLSGHECLFLTKIEYSLAPLFYFDGEQLVDPSI